MLNPGLSRSPQLLLAMAWLVGAKKVADRHSSPSTSAGLTQCQTSKKCQTSNLLILNVALFKLRHSAAGITHEARTSS